MNLKAAEIRKKDFKKSFRGYDPNEVEAFLDTVSSHYEKLVLEIATLNNRIKSLVCDVEVYKENEINLQKAIVRAQDIGEEILENAKKRAQNIVKEAELNAQKVRQNFDEDIINQRAELEEIKQKNDKMIEDTKMFLMDKLNELEDYIKNKRIYKMELANPKMLDAEEKTDIEISPTEKITVNTAAGNLSDFGLTSRPFDENFEVK
jgi:DivIVA domain-containing protein